MAFFIMSVPGCCGPEQRLTHLSAPSALFTGNKREWKEWFGSKPHGKRGRLRKELVMAGFTGKGEERRVCGTDTGKVGSGGKERKRGMSSWVGMWGRAFGRAEAWEVSSG